MSKFKRRTNADYEAETGHSMEIYRPQEPPSNYVAGPRSTQIQQLRPHETHMDVIHPATQHVELRTSAVDRAQGFQIMITPVSVVLAVLAVLVSLAFDNELLSFASILIFWGTFAVLYALVWLLTALMTPEAISFFSANRQWNVIDREQKETWDHYKWQAGRPVSSGKVVKIGDIEFPVGLVYAGIVAGLLLGLLLAVLYLLEGGL